MLYVYNRIAAHWCTLTMPGRIVHHKAHKRQHTAISQTFELLEKFITKWQKLALTLTLITLQRVEIEKHQNHIRIAHEIKNMSSDLTFFMSDHFRKIIMCALL